MMHSGHMSFINFYIKDDMTEEEKKIEYDRCINGHDGMTGEEYFWYNYAGGKGMKNTTYSQEGWDEYEKEALRMRSAKARIKSIDYNQKPLTPLMLKKSFKL